MSISPKERFLDICHFKRPGDLWLRDIFWEETLESWVGQGAPEEIKNPSFQTDYFQLQQIRRLGGIRSSLPSAGEKDEDVKFDLGHVYSPFTWGVR